MVLTTLFSVFGFYKSFEAGEVCAPEAAVLVEPVVYRAERFRVELVDAVPAFAVFTHQVGAAQKAQVFGDGRSGDREGSSDFSSGLAAPA